MKVRGVMLTLVLAGCAGGVPDATSPITVDSFDDTGALQAHMVANGISVTVQSQFAGTGDATTRVVTIRGADGTLYAERDIGLAGGSPAGSVGGYPFGHPGDPDADQDAWSDIASSPAGLIVAAVGRASADAALENTDAGEALDEVTRVSDTLDQLAGITSAPAADPEPAAGWCGPGRECPKVHFWNYVCSSSASLWRTHFERGNAPYELTGNADVYSDAVYIYDIQYNRRAAHVTALKGPDNKGGPPFPEHRVSGYMNMTGNLCACPKNTPGSCSPYQS